MKGRIAPLVAAGLLVGASLGILVLAASEGPQDVYAVTTMTVTYTAVVSNGGTGPAELVPLTVAFPRPSEPNQDVLATHADPEPNRTFEDGLGNQFASYVIDQLPAGSNFTATFTATVVLRSMDINIRPGAGGTYGGEQDAFLQPTVYADSDNPVVVSKARELESPSGDVYETVWNIYDFIIDSIAYQQLPGEWSASWVLTHGEGGSAELGNVFVALARASGIPARRISGWGEPFNVSETRSVNRFSHGWAEFYMPGFGWIPADPTWGKAHRFDNLGRPDDMHLVMTKGEGIHFFQRGAGVQPGGDADLSTDYRATTLDRQTQIVSLEHEIVLGFLYGLPIFFAAVALWRVHELRKQAGRVRRDDPEGG